MVRKTENSVIATMRINITGDLRWLTIDTIDLLGVHTDHLVDMPDLMVDHIADMVTVGQVLTEDIILGEHSADGKS